MKNKQKKTLQLLSYREKSQLDALRHLTLPELRMPLSMQRKMTTQAASKQRARGQRTGPGSCSPSLFTTPRTFTLNTHKHCVSLKFNLQYCAIG